MQNLKRNPFLITSLCLSFSLILPLITFAMSSWPPDPSAGPDVSGCSFQIVLKVVDGDTFEIANGGKVRLIGVDTPETVDPRKTVEWFGREASKKLREWVEGKTVCLKQDIDKTQNVDKYGRLLRYTWIYTFQKYVPDKPIIHEGFFVNAELIRQGYGFAYTRYPFQYLEDFRQYQRTARENNLGLWNREKQEQWERETQKNRALSVTCNTSDTICPEDALNHAGSSRTVRFFIEKSYDSGRAVFLNNKKNFEDADNFTAVIFRNDKKDFPPHAADFYWGKTVDVSGTIKKYKGRAEIILRDKSQIRIVDSSPD
jgi:micrococcal nuclease